MLAHIQGNAPGRLTSKFWHTRPLVSSAYVRICLTGIVPLVQSNLTSVRMFGHVSRVLCLCSRLYIEAFSPTRRAPVANTPKAEAYYSYAGGGIAFET